VPVDADWRPVGTRVRMTTDASAAPHTYLSTACFHEECGACRNTCKYCNAPCSHACHPSSGRNLPEPWTDQAQAVAMELLDAIYPGDVPDELAQRIATDPDLFWLRGEAQPPGEWRAAEDRAGEHDHQEES
jgi:hypothetical protein